jgi:hypothetical protein
MSDAQVKGVSRTKAAGQAKARDQVRVLYGVHALEASLAGRMVSDVRQALRQPLNISPQAVAVVDGHEVGESFVLLAGQQLEFVRLAGEKGVIPGAPHVTWLRSIPRWPNSFRRRTIRARGSMFGFKRTRREEP